MLSVLIRIASYEYAQHTITVQKSEKISLKYRHLPPDLWLTLSGSDYPYLEQICLLTWRYD